MTWEIENSSGFEQDKIKYDTVRYTGVGRGADLGCGPKRIWANSVGIDQFVSPDGATIVGDITDLSMFADGAFPWVFSSHALEDHPAERNVEILREWWRVVRSGGYLLLYLPDESLYPLVGEYGANPAHQQNLNRDIVIAAMKEAAPGGWSLVENELRGDTNQYSFYQVFKRTDDGEFREEWADPKPDKTVCVCRFGGIGDIFQMSALLPSLKRAGYTVTVMTTPKGKHLLQNDPNIDDWIIQDTDQVPNQELTAYWAAWAKRFTKFIQLSESVEGTLLAMPGRANHAWPNALRTREMSKNYLEFTFDLAEMPYDPDPRFYPTKEEEAALASSELFAEDRFIVLWPLAGSSLHKFYPHQDTVVARIMMEMPDAVVVFVGDEACRLLEQGWEEERRVFCMSGELGIRDTLTLALKSHCVVGSETGVLNAVAFEDMAKVVMLSHSTAENLTRDWKNTTAISAPYDPDVPICNNVACHRLHMSDEFCPTDPTTGASACSVSIDPANVFTAIKAAYETRTNH